MFQVQLDQPRDRFVLLVREWDRNRSVAEVLSGVGQQKTIMVNEIRTDEDEVFADRETEVAS